MAVRLQAKTAPSRHAPVDLTAKDLSMSILMALGLLMAYVAKHVLLHLGVSVPHQALVPIPVLRECSALVEPQLLKNVLVVLGVMKVQQLAIFAKVFIILLIK
jgi:hypothetical protein